MLDYPKEQLWELYENLPKDLKGAVFTEKNADFIHDICARNKVSKENKISEIAKNVTYILLGLLPPDEFQQVLEKEIKIKENVAKQIALEINRFVLLPVKESLGALYKIEIKPGMKPKTAPMPKAPEKKPKKSDRYREPLK